MLWFSIFPCSMYYPIKNTRFQWLAKKLLWLCNEPKMAIELLVTIAHGVWLARNRFGFEGKKMVATQVTSKGLHSHQKVNGVAPDCEWQWV